MNNKRKGNEYEERVRKCIASGALWFDKGDIKTDTHLIDCKYTEQKGFRITSKILQKIWNEALDSNKLPALIIGIKDKNCTWNLSIQINREGN